MIVYTHDESVIFYRKDDGDQKFVGTTYQIGKSKM